MWGGAVQLPREAVKPPSLFPPAEPAAAADFVRRRGGCKRVKVKCGNRRAARSCSSVGGLQLTRRSLGARKCQNSLDSLSGQAYDVPMITLDGYLEGGAAFANRTLRSEPALSECLNTLHAAFDRITDQLATDDSDLPSMFVGMAHASFLASVILGASGQVPVTAMVLRGCIENAYYGFCTNGSPALFELWSSRHDSEEAARKVKETFRIGSMKQRLRQHDPDLAKRAEVIYAYAIEQGAHPNVHALLSHVSLKEPEGVSWQFVVSDQGALRTVLLMLILGGVTTLEVFRLCYPESFERAGITDRITGLHGKIRAIVANRSSGVAAPNSGDPTAS